MALTAAQILALHTTLKTRFNAGLAATPDDWKKIAKLIQSDGKSNTYAWLSQFPAFREWVGSRLHKVAAETAYTVANRKFEATLDVERTDIEDDNFSHYGAISESQGQSAKDLMNDLVYQKVVDGFTGVCYDGQYFFDTDHPVYPNEDGSGVAVSVSNMQAGAGAPWVLLCTKRAAAPLYLQERIKPAFESLTNANASETVFNYDKFSFGARWRGDAAFGFWQCAFGSKAALTAANFEAGYDAGMTVKGDGNRKLGIVYDTLLVGPSNRAAAEAILTKEHLAGGETNTNYKRVELIVTPWMP
jgi:phage major head subunit gpT-like protein